MDDSGIPIRPDQRMPIIFYMNCCCGGHHNVAGQAFARAAVSEVLRIEDHPQQQYTYPLGHFPQTSHYPYRPYRPHYSRRGGGGHHRYSHRQPHRRRTEHESPPRKERPLEDEGSRRRDDEE